MEESNSNSPKLLRIREVMQRTGLSKSTIYSLMKADEFPHPVRVGERIVRWLAADVDASILAWAARRS